MAVSMLSPSQQGDEASRLTRLRKPISIDYSRIFLMSFRNILLWNFLPGKHFTVVDNFKI